MLEKEGYGGFVGVYLGVYALSSFIKNKLFKILNLFLMDCPQTKKILFQVLNARIIFAQYICVAFCIAFQKNYAIKNTIATERDAGGIKITGGAP